MTIKFLYQILLLSLLSLYSFSQTALRKGEKIDSSDLLLIKFCTTNIKITKKVLLFKDSLITIETEIGYVQELLNQVKHNTDQTRLIASILSDTASRYIDAIKIASKLEMPGVLNSMAALLIDQKNCWISNNNPPLLFCRVTKHVYNYHCGFDCGDGGRRYYVDKYMFLEVMDWIY